MQKAHHAGLVHPGDRKAQSFKILGDFFPGAVLLKPQFGMTVEITPEFDELGFEFGDIAGNVHNEIPVGSEFQLRLATVYPMEALPLRVPGSEFRVSSFYFRHYMNPA